MCNIQRKGIGMMGRTVMSRLHFGRIELNSALFKIRKHNTGSYEFFEREETFLHVMIYCPKYDAERSDRY